VGDASSPSGVDANVSHDRARWEMSLSIYIHIYTDIYGKKNLATTRVFFSLEADFSITICVGIIFSLLSWHFGMRSIQNRSRKNFAKYACFAYVDYQTLGHDRKN
jgi:hypothetical protein